jgi:hypothetical protein
MAATIPIQIGGDRWNANVYGSLAAASELAAEFDRPTGTSAKAIGAEELCQFLDRLNGFLARGLSLTDSLQEAPVAIPKEKLIAARDSFLDLYRICERILSLSREISQLGQMSSELELLHNQSERLLDVVDWFDALSTPEEIEAIFKAAEIEREAGEFVSWSEVD